MKKKKSKNSSVFLNEEKDVTLDSSINEEDMLQGIEIVNRNREELNNQRNNRINKFERNDSGQMIERHKIRYNIDGKFIKEWESATSCESDGYQQSAVSNVCNQKQISAYGYLWKYKQDERPITEWVERVKNKKQAGKPKKVVLQYDLNMNLIAEYESAAAAARAMGKTSKSNLCRAARENKTAYGYLWKYKED